MHRYSEGVGEFVLRVLGQPVVAQVPDHGLEMAEHAEIVRHALAGDVPDGAGDAGGGKIVDVLLRVPRRTSPNPGRSGLTPS